MLCANCHESSRFFHSNVPLSSKETECVCGLNLTAIKHSLQPCWKAIMKIFYAVLGITVSWLQPNALPARFELDSGSRVEDAASNAD